MTSNVYIYISFTQAIIYDCSASHYIHSAYPAMRSYQNFETIKENCKFKFYYNKTDITPTVLDGGKEIILANWPNNK